LYVRHKKTARDKRHNRNRVGETVVGIEEKKKIASRAGYQREWKAKRKLKEQLLLEARRKGDGWYEFQEHVRKEAMKKGVGAAVMGIYKEMLKIERAERKVGGGIGGDEIARRNIQAERELQEGGYIE